MLIPLTEIAASAALVSINIANAKHAMLFRAELDSAAETRDTAPLTTLIQSSPLDDALSLYLRTINMLQVRSRPVFRVASRPLVEETGPTRASAEFTFYAMYSIGL